MRVLFDTFYRDFWQYFQPIREFMPQNCSADVEAVMTYVDSVLTNGTARNIQLLEAKFNIQGIQHADDAAAACEFQVSDIRR